ncbi:MAG TPA: sulfatase-like hydrolase/transferase [Bacteroidia bacterium]|jgi:phosphoglycerol transferase MdoB-like AlkP superfamily enzyme
MRKIFIILLVAFCQAFASRASDTDTASLVKQEIRYVSEEASEVFMVWGINSWSIPAEAMRPEGSFVKDNLLYTPMKKKPYGFSSELALPANTMMDYIFWITQGPAGKPVDVWDLNMPPQKDYHTAAISNNVTLINSKVNVRPKAALSILDFATPLLGGSAVLFFLFLILRTYRLGSTPINTGPVKIIISASIVLALGLIFVRASITGQSWDLYLHPFRSFPKVLWAGFYDVVYVLIVSGFFLLLLSISKNSRVRSLLTGSFLFVALTSFVAGILNIRVVETIGKPFNYPWLYYSDFLKSADSHAAVSSNITVEYILQIVMVCMAAFFTGMLILMVTELLLQRLRMKGTLLSSLVCTSAIYITLAPDAIKHYNWNYDTLANPVVAFAGSFGPFSGEPALFTMSVDDSLKFELFSKKPVPHKKHPKIKNVIVFVLESTPAEYIQPYSKGYQVTPQLEKYLSEAVVFDNIYAHAPATNNSMVSLLGSTYPWLSYNSITKEHPDLPIATISSELKKRGYRTAFFNSADNRFQKAGEFLGNRKFDEIKDCNTLECSAHFEVKDEKWDFLDGKDDECTAEDLFSWIKKDTAQPFFTMMWTYQTHYPYFVSGEEKAYAPADPTFNRYLNAVHHSDIALGKLIEELKSNGLYESTLVVVVGDHGEAFGRHNQTTHASGIYEENLHVPCIFINPAFKAERHPGIGGLVDIAPTIMNQLGYPSADQWQGKDLFTSTLNDRVYFFTPWADYLFGYREGNKKYIYNATKNLSEMYDLENDPFESRNISAEYPELMERSHQRIAGWVQSHNEYMSKLLTSK